MLSIAKEKLIKSLHTKKGRQKHDKCLVEGRKVVDMAVKYVDFKFTPKDTQNFSDLVTTQAPQKVAAVANIPHFSLEDLKKLDVIVVLDGVQDPGNVGAILRLCLGFHAGLILVECADATNPKVIRSSVGAMFKTPWMMVERENIEATLKNMGRRIYRLEKTYKAEEVSDINLNKPCAIIAGSEGSGIQLKTSGQSMYIQHNSKLESLNVANALAITLHGIK